MAAIKTVYLTSLDAAGEKGFDIASTESDPAAKLALDPKRFSYSVNQTERVHSVWPTFAINGQAAQASSSVHAGDKIRVIEPSIPMISEVIGTRPLRNRASGALAATCASFR